MGWLFSSCDDEASTSCDAVDPSATPPLPLLLLSLSPFILTFSLAIFLSLRHVFPRLSRVQGDSSRDGEDHFLPAHAPAALRQAHAEHGAKSMRRQIAAWVFASTIGLATVLAELILAEVLEVVDPRAKMAALRVVVPLLVAELVLVVPFLEVQSLVNGQGWALSFEKGKRRRAAWLVQLVVFGGYLLAFWSVGLVVPLGDHEGDGIGAGSGTGRMGDGKAGGHDTGSGGHAWTDGLTRACLERIGVIGISLMALLSGFASISSPWHTFGPGGAASFRRRPITESDLLRRQGGIDATNEMLTTKRHRLQALQRKAAEAQTTTSSAASSAGFMGKVLGTIRGATGEEVEMRALRLEIAGLETMEVQLSATLANMRAQRDNDMRAASPWGKVLNIPSYIFALYCIYRVLATSLTTLHRLVSPMAYQQGLGGSATDASFSSTDPISRFLGLLARHWDPKLDQLAWARQISFLLSGVILAASASSALQTFRLFAKWAPGLLYHAQANLALLIGQVAAAYVISAALLLRSSLPREVGSVVGDGVLRSALMVPGQTGTGQGFVDRWFEGWFLVAASLTAAGIWVGRRLGGGEAGWEEWDDLAGEEMGQKRS